MAVCGLCGNDNADGAKFCNECAAPLRAPGVEVRKTVTLVFCDLVGSTALGERVDAEVLRSVMGDYHARLRGVLEEHGGTVEKFVGDAVMAVFGIPLVHEDDALRAVRAAIQMRDAATDLGLEVRIGVNTGEVVAGAGETLVTGDAVNVAARLEQGADTGQILVGADTERLVRQSVLLKPVEPLVAKGKSRPVPAYEVTGVLNAAASPAGTAPLVGRRDELALLEEVLRLARDKRMPQLITVTGAPGVGKSRLIAELISRVSGRVMVGHCVSYGDAITYRPIIEVLESIGDVQEALGSADDATLVSTRLAAAVGTPGAAASPEEIAWAFRRLCESLAGDGLVVVVLEDIHWAEPTLLDLVEYVSTFTQDAALVLLCTARPELFDVRPSWATPRPHATLVQLDPLAPADAASLVRELDNLPDDVLLRIVDASDGNPLFVEQLVAMHRDSPSSDVEVPPTLRALLASRIDRLETEERQVVERASVEGRLFHRGAVTELLPERNRPQAAMHLVGLVRRELIRPDRATIRGDDAFRFAHLLIRDAAYDSMSKRVRAELHERYADWLVARLGDGAAPEIVGYHLEQAHGYRRELGHQDTTDLADRTAAVLGEAGRAAMSRSDVAAAVKTFERALALAREPARRQLLFDFVPALRACGNTKREGEVVAELLGLAETPGDQQFLWRTRLLDADLRMRLEPEGAAERGRATAEAVIVQAADDDHQLLAEAWSMLSEVQGIHGRFADQLAALDTALDHARKAGDRQLETELSGAVGGTLVYGPEPVDEGRRRLADLMERSGHIAAIQDMAQHALAHLDARQGLAVGAREGLAAFRAHRRELGHEMGYAVTAGCVWDILELSDEIEVAEQALLESYAILERVGDKFRCTQAALLGDAALRQGRLDDAQRWVSISEELGTRDDYFNEAVWRSVRARILSSRGEHDRAAAFAVSAVECAEKTDLLETKADTRMSLATVLLAAGDPEAAAAEAEQALAMYESKGNAVNVGRTERFLAGLAPAR